MASHYQDKLFTHLANYKTKSLGIALPGVFRHRGKDIEKAHILPRDQGWLNILSPVRDDVRAYVSKHPHVRLHRYFHHLNSSQAFALNLFVPFFQAGPEGSQSLLSALGQEGAVADGAWALEVVPDSVENTSIDVTWTTSLGTKYVCEVKLSEQEFGKARADQDHLRKLRDVYAPQLRDHIPESLLEPRTFFSNYQIFRNIWHMLHDPEQRLLFLMPRANDRLWIQLDAILSKLSPELNRRISAEAIEDVLKRIRGDERCPGTLRIHAGLLAEKYICPVSEPA